MIFREIFEIMQGGEAFIIPGSWSRDIEIRINFFGRHEDAFIFPANITNCMLLWNA